MQFLASPRRRSTIIAIVLAMLCCALFPGISVAQPYTSQPIKIIVPYTPGTGNDILARTIGQRINEKWKIPVVVENRPGASGNIGTAAVARAAPDGLTLLVAPNNFVINPYVFKDAQYDPFKDFEPVALLGWGRLLLVANPATRFANARGLIEAATAQKNKSGALRQRQEQKLESSPCQEHGKLRVQWISNASLARLRPAMRL